MKEYLSKLKAQSMQPASKGWVAVFYTLLLLFFTGWMHWNLYNERSMNERISRIEYSPQVTRGEFSLLGYKFKAVDDFDRELSKRVWIAEKKLAAAEKRVAELEKQQGKLPTQMFFIPQPPVPAPAPQPQPQ